MPESSTASVNIHVRDTARPEVHSFRSAEGYVYVVSPGGKYQPHTLIYSSADALVKLSAALERFIAERCEQRDPAFCLDLDCLTKEVPALTP